MFEESLMDISTFNKTELYFLAKKLEDISIEIGQLTEEEKQFIIERVETKNSAAIARLCNTIIHYLGW